jgi:hypothetical protein
MGLCINNSKSQLTPISVTFELLAQLAADFGYQVGTMTFTYLGLPLRTTWLTISNLMPLVCHLERKLMSSSSFLSQGARLQQISYALASMSLHFYVLYKFLRVKKKQIFFKTMLIEGL